MRVQNVQGLHGITGTIKCDYITREMVAKNTITILTELHLNKKTAEKIPQQV